MTNKKKALIYCRVSTTKQWSNWDSLQTQEKACRNYCKLSWISVIWVFKEEFTWKSSNRPIFNEAINNAIENKVDFFIVFDIDRFSREWYSAYSTTKNKLNNNWIKLKDSKNIIWDEKIVIQNDTIDMSQYKWNMENPTEMSEMVYSAQAKIEWNKIIQRTIPKEIILEQQGYQVREANFWYTNQKIKTDEWKKSIQVKHHIEWEWIIEMFNLKAKWKLNDEEIVKEISLMWYKSRRWKTLIIKQMQIYIKKPIYAWIIKSKWTWYKPIKAKYEWLVSIEVWNKANIWKFKIVELENWEIQILDKKNDKIETPIIQRRNRFNPNMPFRNLVKSSLLKDQLISWSYSSNSKWQKFWYYHPIRKRWKTWENIKKDEFENNIYKLFDDIEVNEILKTIFIDRFDHIFTENKTELINKRKVFEDRLSEINNQIAKQEANLDSIDTNLTRVLKSIEKKLEKLDWEKESLEKKINSFNEAKFDNPEKFKKFCFNMLEHLPKLLKQSQNFEQLDLVFKFVFTETPSYDEIVNRTASMYPIFALNSKKELSKIESSSLNLKWQPH
jgi:DNA invertase Pin-like site-specific DNA recombinase